MTQDLAASTPLLAEASVAASAVRTFLIADVRGYTRFTQEQGDEAAARLATRFATLMRERVAARGGQVTKLRGDEALAVFSSAWQALRAGLAVQACFAHEAAAYPSLPLKQPDCPTDCAGRSTVVRVRVAWDEWRWR